MTTPGMQGEVSPESIGKTRLQPGRRETGHFRNYLGTLRNKVGQTLPSAAVWFTSRLGIRQ